MIKHCYACIVKFDMTVVYTLAFYKIKLLFIKMTIPIKCAILTHLGNSVHGYIFSRIQGVYVPKYWQGLHNTFNYICTWVYIYIYILVRHIYIYIYIPDINETRWVFIHHAAYIHMLMCLVKYYWLCYNVMQLINITNRCMFVYLHADTHTHTHIYTLGIIVAEI